MVTKKEEAENIDSGDKVSASLSFKKNLGNYQTIDFYAGVTVCKRDSETSEEVWERAWGIVEEQLDSQVEKASKILAESK